MMDSKNLLIKRPDPKAEFMTPEGCRILEVWNDESDRAVSIARATVAQGVTTKLHRVREVDERYVITANARIQQGLQADSTYVSATI